MLKGVTSRVSGLRVSAADSQEDRELQSRLRVMDIDEAYLFQLPNVGNLYLDAPSNTLRRLNYENLIWTPSGPFQRI